MQFDDCCTSLQMHIREGKKFRKKKKKERRDV